MKINLIHLVLILVALQSTMAVADLHQSHQTGNDHLEFNHLDQFNDDSVNKPTIKSTYLAENIANDYDCHHCCHCHGVACHYMDNQQIDYVSSFGSSNLLEILTLFTSRITSPNFRPPIV